MAALTVSLSVVPARLADVPRLTASVAVVAVRRTVELGHEFSGVPPIGEFGYVGFVGDPIYAFDGNPIFPLE